MCGYVNIRRDQPSETEYFARLAYLQGITGRVPPMRPIPVMTGRETCLVARWGWPNPRGGILTHARSETAATLPTWREAWRSRRGVIPVVGWEEGSWQISAPGAHLAVLWMAQGEDVRLVVLTEAPPAEYQFIERFPVALTQRGASAWLADGELRSQVQGFQVEAKAGQQTIFDR